MDKQKEINPKLIGFIIKQERLKKNISASKLALGIKKSRQYISDIEKGMKSVSHATITEIFEFLNIKFEYQECTEAQDLFQKFIDYYYLRDIPNAINRLATIISNDVYKYSYDYPLIILCDFIFQELTHSNSNLSGDLFEFLNEIQCCIFLYFKGFSLLNKKQYEEALQSLRDAKKYEVHIPKFKGLIYYAEALGYDRLSDYLKSLEYNKKAKHEFLEYHNVERSLTSSLHIANIYSKIGRLQESIELYSDIYYEAKRFQIYRIIELIHYNLAIAFLYNQQFQDAINEIHKLEYSRNMLADYFFVLTWAYYELGEYIESKKNLEKLIQCNTIELYYQHIITLQSLRLQKDFNDGVYEQYLENIVSYVLKNELLPEQIFILKHTIEYFEQKKDYESAYKYSNKLNVLLNQRI